MCSVGSGLGFAQGRQVYSTENHFFKDFTMQMVIGHSGTQNVIAGEPSFSDSDESILYKDKATRSHLFQSEFDSKQHICKHQ